MKKVLALLLSVLMLFSAFTTSSFAASYSLVDQLRETDVINDNQVILSFNLQGGTIFGAVPVYNTDTGLFESVEGVTGIYHMIPDNSQMANGTYGSPLHTAGTTVPLPSVIAPEGFVFDGWEYNNRVYTGNSFFKIPVANYELYPSKAVLYFTAVYSPAEVEGDIFSTLIGVVAGYLGEILVKLGIIEDAAVIEELLSGLF